MRESDVRTRPQASPAIWWVAAAVLVVACAVHFFFGYYSFGLSGHAWGADDAYISYRYAQHLAEGQGIVFNAGERVEGYSNFLYVLLAAGAIRLGAAPYGFMAVAGVLFSLAALVVFVAYARSRLGDGPAGTAALLFALSPPIWLWTTSGLETPLVLLAQLAIWAAASRVAEGGGRRNVALLCAAVAVSVLARCDGFIVPILALCWLAHVRRWRPALAVAITLAAVLVPYEIWRWCYYGDALPNVFYAKVSGPLGQRLAAGLAHLGTILLRDGLIVPVAALVISLVATVRRRTALRFEHVLFAGLTGYWLFIGGDAFQERFLLVLYPLGAFAALRLASEAGARRWALPAAALVLAACQFMPLAVDGRFVHSTRKYDLWLTLGRFLADRFPGGTLAIDGAGKVPFVSRMLTIDMLGINDRTLARKKTDFTIVAHNKFDPDYVLARRPDVIAAWTNPWLDLLWGLVKGKYEAAGYRRAYLVNGKCGSREPNIIDVRGMSEEETRALIVDGYTYAVLVREP